AGGGEAWMHIDAETAFAPLRRVITAPTRQEAQRLGDLVHADGFGDALHTRPLAKPPSWTQILRAPRDAWDDYWRCYWREAYVTRLVGRNPTFRRSLWIALQLAQKQVALARRVTGLKVRR